MACSASLPLQAGFPLLSSLVRFKQQQERRTSHIAHHIHFTRPRMLGFTTFTVVAVAALAGTAAAQLERMRATIPGSLHQCGE